MQNWILHAVLRQAFRPGEQTKIELICPTGKSVRRCKTDTLVIQSQHEPIVVTRIRSNYDATPSCIQYTGMNRDLAEEIARRLCEAQGWPELSYIDAGNSGTVFRIVHPKYGPVALKIYDPSFFTGDNALIEQNRVKLQEQLRSHGNPYLVDKGATSVYYR